jgi:uncharacterized protein YoxC
VESVLVAAQILALLCLSALCVYLITIILRLRDLLGKVESDVKEITTRAVPVLDNVEYITNRLKSISDNIDDQVAMVRDSIGSVRSVADNIVALERQVQARVEGPILETVGLVAAVLKGLRAFADRVRS